MYVNLHTKLSVLGSEKENRARKKIALDYLSIPFLIPRFRFSFRIPHLASHDEPN